MLTTRQVADALRVSMRHVRDLARRNGIRGRRDHKGDWAWPDMIIAALASRRRTRGRPKGSKNRKMIE